MILFNVFSLLPYIYYLCLIRNVLQDEAGRLKVTDFGLSKFSQEIDVHGYKMTGGTGSCKV